MIIPSTNPMRADVLKGKRILITGGGTGLGKELARSFSAHGASVHICGRRQAVLDATVEELKATAAHGGGVEAHVCEDLGHRTVSGVASPIIDDKVLGEHSRGTFPISTGYG